MTKDDLMLVLQNILDRLESDGCVDCAFDDVNGWEMPCAKCRRNCKDYWRPKEGYKKDNYKDNDI